MRKQTYIKPTMEILTIQEQEYLMAGSLTDTTTNLGTGDDIDLQDDEVGDGFWGR